MKIAITGGTGFIGSHIVEALAARGHEVTCLARNPEKEKIFAGLPVRFVHGTMDSTEALSRLVKRQDVVIHLAGLTKAGSFEEYVRANVGGTEKLLEAMRTSSPAPRQFVLFSSAEAMGPSPGGAPLTEDAEPKPFTAYGKSKMMAEQCAERVSGEIPVTIIRPPAVYGPRDKDVAILFRLLSRGFQPVVRPLPSFSVLYVKNLAAAICQVVEGVRAGVRSYFLTDGKPCSWLEFGCLIARALGKKTLRLVVPRAVIHAIAGAAGFLTAITGKSGILSKDKIEALIGSWVVSDERARRELGYSPTYSTEQGITETAEWYRESGWL
ncbi:MAG TPA: NAD-dependent epimerase/dehydratase family protein [Spirochaetia bacterium]|nr:NAD-dependent epimerase/dehydratase family protein [Spirochaetia bacterium]